MKGNTWLWVLVGAGALYLFSQNSSSTNVANASLAAQQDLANAQTANEVASIIVANI
jgi:hypothetical protein